MQSDTLSQHVRWKNSCTLLTQCRTEALGGHLYACPACGTRRYSYHSCRNRHCPTCQHDAAQTWLSRQQELLLPLRYLAPYIFRVALSNNRIVRVADEQVTFRYTIGDTGQTAYCTLPVQEFLRRFLQHILPKGFVKVRSYGLFRVGMRRSLARLRSQLRLLQHIAAQATPAPATSDGSTRVVICPSCGQPMRWGRVVLPHNRGPPSWVNQQQ